MSNTTPERQAADRALLRFLQRQNRITSEDVSRLETAVSAGEATVPQLLEREGLINEKDLAVLLANTLRLRLIDLTSFPLDPQVARELKEQVATRYEVVPIRIDGGTIEVAIANPLDVDGLRAVEFATGKRVQALVATETEVRDALGHAYRLQESLEQFLQHVPAEESLTVTELQDAGDDLRTIARDAELPPVVKLADLILIEGIKSRASDVHVEPSTDTVAVRYRVDGILEESFRFPKWVQNPLIARLKVMAKLDITERRVPQDGRIQIRYHDALVDLRVSSLPAQHGEKITLRILHAAASVQVLDRIGLAPSGLAVMREAIRRPQGMILLTGPTGSGKTTTLYALLREMFSPTINIVTIENPIEYQLKGVNQVEVNEKQGLTFAGVLRSILRQDPDVILLGEIRDQETAQIAFQAATTGHLVFSTVHTNDAAGAVTRLIDLGVEPYTVASALNLVVAQRLVRRICPSCAVPVEVTEELRRALRLPDEVTSLKRGTGCNACRQSGYFGRSGLYEMLPVSAPIAKLIESGATESVVRQQARSEGWPSILEDAHDKLVAGLTTADEVLRVVQVDDGETRCPGCKHLVEEDYAVCPHCSRVLRATCGGCGKPLGPEWVSCPYCGTAATATGAVPAAAAAAPAPEPEARSYTALVVDDTETIREIVRLTLERSNLGLRVVTACDGEEALAAATKERPDVVILDISMPGMDGFEVCRRLRSEVRTAFVPVLMLTAHDTEEFIEKGFGVGADDYMTKPFNRENLIARIRRMLERTYGAGALVRPTGVAAVPAPAAPPGASVGPAIGGAALEAWTTRLEACERRLEGLAVRVDGLVVSGAAAVAAHAAAPGAAGDPDALADVRHELQSVRRAAEAAAAAARSEIEQLGQRVEDAARTPAAPVGRDEAALGELRAAVDRVQVLVEQEKARGEARASQLQGDQAQLAAAVEAARAALDEARAGLAREQARGEDVQQRLVALATRFEGDASARGAAAASVLPPVRDDGDAVAELRAAVAQVLAAAEQERARTEARLGQLQGDQAQVAAVVETARAALDEARAGLAREQARGEDVQQRLAVLASRLEADATGRAERETAMAGVLTQLRHDVAELRASQEAVTGRMQGVRGDVESLLAEAARRAEDAAAQLGRRVGAVQETVDRLAEDHETLAQAVAAAARDERRAALGATVGTLEEQLGALAERLEREASDRVAMAARVDAETSARAALAARLEDEAARRSTVLARIDAEAAERAALAQRLDADAADRAALAQRLAAADVELAGLAETADRLAQLTERVEELQIGQSELLRRLATSSADGADAALVAGHEARLAALAARLDAEAAERAASTAAVSDAAERQLADVRATLELVRAAQGRAASDASEAGHAAAIALERQAAVDERVDALVREATRGFEDEVGALRRRLEDLTARVSREAAAAPADGPTGDQVLDMRHAMLEEVRRDLATLREGGQYAWAPGIRGVLGQLVDAALAAAVAPTLRRIANAASLGFFADAEEEPATPAPDGAPPDEGPYDAADASENPDA